MFKLKSSLKTQIIFSAGIVIVTLMLLISIVMLLQWRNIIIKKQTENVFAVSKTFSVTIVDALIFEEKSVYQKENILETYIDNFINRLGNVKYVAIFDRNAAPLASRVFDGEKIVSAINIQFDDIAASNEHIEIFKDDSLGWIIQCDLPMLFSDRNWGYVKIGFDAQPIRDEIGNLFFMLLIATVILTSIVLIILYLSINHLTSSLEKLVLEIDKIDFVSDAEISLPVKNDEIGFLYHHFGLLKKRLENSRSELKNAQRQIYQAEKLASIGRLASGVAHQVNNPLNGIKSCLYAIRKDANNISQTKEYIELISEGIDNIETVVKKLLGFARQPSQSEMVIDVNDSIMKVVGFFDYRLKENKIKLELSLEKNTPPIKIDYQLFQEVIMNLLLNSFDAIKEEGDIKISTTNFDEKNIVIEVADTGSGIEPKIIKKIFDPFFTTKEIGTGTGLGLSVCLGIIESHNGRIEVESDPGFGTKMKVFLPTEGKSETINN